MAASPTVGDVRSLNKLARQIKSQPVKRQICLLTRPLRMLGFPDASYRNNDDGPSQRRHDSVLGSIVRAIDNGWNDVLKSDGDSALHYRGGAVFLHDVLWFMSVSPWIVDGHIR